jgi:hypothetical protein
MKLLGSIGATATVMAMLTGTAAAISHKPSALTTYHTAFVQQSPNGAGQVEGTMHLRIASNGVIQGDYRPAGGRLQDVVGGLTDGDQIWLNIGETRVIHLTGTYQAGKIVAFTYLDDTGSWILPDVPRQYEFDAAPEASPPQA